MGALDDNTGHPLPGETIGGMLSGERYLQEGGRHWFLENLRPLDQLEPPAIYTHNVNLDGLLHYALRQVGAKSHVPLAIANAVGFCAGLWMAYLFVLRGSRSLSLALGFLGLLATEYYFNLLFGLNMRGWQWLGLFGVGYAALRLDEPRWRLGIMPFAIVAFTAGYDFAAVAGLLGVLVAIMRAPTWRQAGQHVGWVVGALAVPLVLRQIQVLGAVGVTVWAQDLWYTILIKVPFLHGWFYLPPLADVDAWYTEHGLVRFPALPVSDPQHFARLVKDLWLAVWWRRIGKLTAWLAAAGIVLALVAIVWSRLRALRPAGQLVLALAVAEIGGSALFLPYSAHFVLKHASPMLIAMILLAAGYAVWAGTSLALRTGHRVWAVAALVLLLAFGWSRLERQWYNAWKFPLLLRSVAPEVDFIHQRASP